MLDNGKAVVTANGRRGLTRISWRWWSSGRHRVLESGGHRVVNARLCFFVVTDDNVRVYVHAHPSCCASNGCVFAASSPAHISTQSDEVFASFESLISLGVGWPLFLASLAKWPFGSIGWYQLSDLPV